MFSDNYQWLSTWKLIDSVKKNSSVHIVRFCPTTHQWKKSVAHIHECDGGMPYASSCCCCGGRWCCDGSCWCCHVRVVTWNVQVCQLTLWIIQPLFVLCIVSVYLTMTCHRFIIAHCEQGPRRTAAQTVRRGTLITSMTWTSKPLHRSLLRSAWI